MFTDSLMTFSATKERITFEIASMSLYVSSLAESSSSALCCGYAANTIEGHVLSRRRGKRC